MISEPAKAKSIQSSPVSIGTMSSEFSEIESVVSLSDHNLEDDAAAKNQEPAPVHPEFAFADGNVEVQTMDQTFWVHEYHFNKFSVFASLIQEAKSSNTTSNSGRRFIVACDDTTKGEDICNTLKVIYASHIDGIPDFDSSILTSTLRIATSFDYPALRRFAISKLEGMDIPAIQRIQLSDELSLPELELPAFTELCSRVEPISHAEADILGMTRFVEVARIRETERTCCKVKDVGEELLQLVDNLLRAEGTVNVEPVQESPGRSELPRCDCHYTDNWGVHRCNLHKVAPQVLEEGKRLLKQRNELLEQLASIRSVVNRGLEPTSREPPSNSKCFSYARDRRWLVWSWQIKSIPSARNDPDFGNSPPRSPIDQGCRGDFGPRHVASWRSDSHWCPTTITSFQTSVPFFYNTITSARMNSESSRPISLHSARAVGTVLSDVEPVVSLNNKHSDADTTAIENQQLAHVHPEFAFTDGNVEVQTTDRTFWVHEYHLSKFAVFAALIQEAKSSEVIPDSGPRFILACDKKTKGEDIYNTLKVIYASHIDGIPDFDSSTLTSTLRIATSFDYPALRNFAISKLEGMNIPAIQRIQLSDEFSLPSWETPAFTELCSRKEPISHTEAEVLGMSRFVEIARIRETERTRLAVKFAGGIYEELLQASEMSNSSQAESSNESGSVENTFVYSSGRSALPACTCSAIRILDTLRVKHCGIHQIAPKVLEEGQKLLKQRDELLERLGTIRHWCPTTIYILCQVAYSPNPQHSNMNSDSARLTLLHGARVASFAGTAHPDTVPAVSLNNKHSDAGTAAIENQQPAPVHPEFAFADGNVEVQTTDQAFWVHEYHLSKFAVFATLIREAKGSETSSNSGRRFIVACDETTKGEDICNTLKVVYASHIDGIADFDSSTLTSTLRIATLFDYPALRKFAISKLEGMNIPAAQRIQLSDEFTLPSWETPAFTELCSRKEPISQAEAEILGMSRFVEIARIRETERARLAVKFAGGIYQELLQASELSSSLEAENSDGSGSAGNTFVRSDIESAAPLNNKHSEADTAATESQRPAPVHPEFAFADGNVEIKTTDQKFWVHEYHLSKFTVFANLIQEAKSSDTTSDSGRRFIV
ncbi:unnamed protein product, partial [Rhizoctonia solani]